MAMTLAQQTDAYRFFSIAFDAAPGVTYMNQIAEAYGNGSSTLDVVEAFVSKVQFTSKYPTFLTNEAFAASIIDNVVGTSATAAAKTQAAADVVASLNSGSSRGLVVYTIFNNLANKTATDADWAGTAAQMANKVAVAQYMTETLRIDTLDLAVLGRPLSGVTNTTDVSTTAALDAIVATTGTETSTATFTLTAAADSVPGMLNIAGNINSAGNDIYQATDLTLNPGDRINDAGGTKDVLAYATSTPFAVAAFEISGIETVQVTNDSPLLGLVSFDLSGSRALAGVNSLNLVKDLNSTADVAFNQITTLANIEINDVTGGASVTVSYQDSVVSGTANDVMLTLANNSNVTPVGVVTVGRTAEANGGIETISAVVSGSASTVTQLDSDISTLNVSGDKALTIITALNSTVDTVAAGSFTGALNINLTGNVAATGESGLSVTTGSGNDVIDMLNGTAATTVAEPGVAGVSGADVGTVVRNVTISTGDGNDSVEAGLGDDSINLGAGTDTLVMTVNGLTVADLVTGGADADTLIFNTSDSISKSEAERVTQVETFDVRNFGAAAGSTIVVTDNLVNTADGGMFTVTTASATRANTTDLTNVSFSSTGKFTLTGNTSGAAMDTVIADDATVNAKATLAFGQDAFTALGVYQGADTLRIVDGGNYTFDDFANVTGLDAIDIRATSNIAQTYNIQLTNGMIDNMDSTDGTVGDAFDALTITVDRNVPQGSVLNINATALTTTTKAVLIRTNANVTVNLVDNNGAILATNASYGVVTVQSSLQFTENSDNLIGTAGADTFTADSLDQMDTADIAQGNDAGLAIDTLQVDFAIQNVAATALAQFNNPVIADIEVLTFNTVNPVSFSTDGIVSVTTVNFGDGADTIGANTEAGTYKFGEGVGRYTEVAGSAVTTTVTTGTSADFVTYGSGADWSANDTISMSTGVDTVTVASVAALDTSTYNLVTGVDVITYNASGVAAALLTIDDNLIDASDSTSVLTINVNDAGTDNSTIFTAAGVVVGNAVNVNVLANAVIAGASTADFIGGAGNDTFTVTVNASVDGTTIRGNGGADTIVLAADTVAANDSQVIEFATENDGAAQGVTTGGWDTISGFQTTIDKIQFAVTEGLELGIDDIAANNAIAWQTDAAANFTLTHEALLLTQLNNSVTDAQLTDAGFATVISKLNVGLVAAAGDEGLVVVQGQTQTGIYWYTEDGIAANTVSTTELKLLGVVTNAILVVGDFQIA